ncbi:MAG: 4Fe-4S binding protein, partial [Lachnospiraceae bacterium]|nr:4Fe-4S binding protein [Lachnospiraceae bacterium]
MRRAYIDPARCVGCGACIRVCPTGAARMMPGWKCRVDPGRCIGCGKCASI